MVPRDQLTSRLARPLIGAGALPLGMKAAPPL
jgi:hypothetical protein